LAQREERRSIVASAGFRCHVAAPAVAVPKMVRQPRDNKWPALECSKMQRKISSLHRQHAMLQGLFRSQRNELRRIEIPCKVNPPPQTFGSRSEARNEIVSDDQQITESRFRRDNAGDNIGR